MRYFITIAALLFLQTIGFPATIYVPGDYPTIQGAIDAAVTGDTVVVAPGSYVENLQIIGKDITLQSSMGAGATVIDGVSPSNPNFGSVVYLESAGSTVIDGFTLKNGTGSYNVYHGIYMGGGVCSYSSYSTVSKCMITENSAGGMGGGIYSENSFLSVQQCVICDNQTSGSGGGITSYYYSTDNFFDCIVCNNTASGKGGGAYLRFDSAVDFFNCTFEGNSGGTGGGLMTDFLADAFVTNSIFWNNSPQQIYVGEDKGATQCDISHSDVQGGQSGVYVAPSSTLNWGAGMINADPLFVEASDGDLHLRFDSPCKDAGAGGGGYDFEGDPRVVGSAIDMGADEFHPHLYHMGDVEPGFGVAIRVIGTPGTVPVILAWSDGIQDPPLSTTFGDLYLALPIPWRYDIGMIPTEGVLTFAGTVPTFFLPGTVQPIQALLGPLIPGSQLTNLHLLPVR